MANIAPPVLIEPPPPAQRPYGLFDVALGPLPMPREEAQAGGVLYVPDTCIEDVYLYALNCPAVSGEKTFAGLDTAITGQPFAAITSYTCGPVGFTTEEAAERVRLRMSLREQRAVERRVWQGFNNSNAQGVLTGLFRGASSLGSAGCPVEAMELLEQALADNGVVGGMIHARPGMAPHLANNHQVVQGPGRLKTSVYGTPLVFGQGYDGTGPSGEATTTAIEYMYASGRVIVWGSDIVIPDPRETFDRTANQMYVLGEKIFVASVECGVWAVAVTRNCTTAGGGT